jgi:cell division protease FtsH
MPNTINKKETLNADEIKYQIKFKRPVRETVIDPAPRSSAVPPSGKPRSAPPPTGDVAPQPQG